MADSKSIKGNESHVVSFAAKQYQQSIKTHKHVLDTFKLGLASALKLEGETPIFLDTNVLLSVYEVSFTAREKIKQFVKDYSKRIYITSQVQHEYIKNRERVINTFQATVTEQIPKNFSNDVVNKLTAFKNANKGKLEDYVEIQNKLTELETTVKSLQTLIKENVDDKKDSANKLLLEDDFLELISKLSFTEPLTQESLKLIRDEFEKLLPIYQSTHSQKKVDDEGNSSKESYSLTVFPGCGEKASKDDPTGDYIVYHELMQFAYNNKVDVLFLTNDTKKGDWLRKDGTTHLHYLENFYNNTNQMIYILEADRLFEQLFKDVSFESLVTTNQEELIDFFADLTVDLLLEYLNQTKIFSGMMEVKSIEKKILDELWHNKITSLFDIDIHLHNRVGFMKEIESEYPGISRIGAMRILLCLTYPSYSIITQENHIVPGIDRVNETLRIKWKTFEGK